ncbi:MULTISPECIES: hypothetical protein [unclassified Bradyrhizobium]|uniref:hypothetical protein n=1 Tax=unclassified Bradyrhizobium TaxID=2631580 RepID=UPI001CD3E6B7|nr:MULTISPECIES: hypothetical protein [unclassified Bradyrhizobium]MCA1382692.1 hypothetical protein [Bradyrhizobium sp. BRP05]MCA1421799.1 hypothetical protein [Bradyrhizobium sp. BRP23]MCA1434656.1 hypothetical protein [Bradyrhizobium sp. BRP20]MCA1549782.1 hypothetical protein [Bradyrhizobium sp. BRP19]
MPEVQVSAGNQHVLLQMPDEPDCHFVAAWLIKAAEAQAFWSEILDRPNGAHRLGLLHADGIPNLAAAALELLGELEHHLHVVSLDLYPDESGIFYREFALLVQLGFFAREDQGYRIALPEQVVFGAVLTAALEVASVMGDMEEGLDLLQPEVGLTTLSGEEAETLRVRLLATRQFSAEGRRSGRLQ